MPEIFVCKDGEIADSQVRIVPIGSDHEVGVYCRNGEYYAYQNTCTHQGGPACEGLLLPKVEDVLGEDRTWRGHQFNEAEMHIICPWHSYEFRLDNGVCATDPALRLKRYDVVQRDGKIYVIV